jgi:hypothetical protein
MSATNQPAGSSRSTDNVIAIFQAASSKYESVTGKRLDAHPFATEFDSCDSPEAVLNVFRIQAQTFDKFRKGDEKLLTWLDPIVHVLFTFSATLGEGIGLVSPSHLFLITTLRHPVFQPFSPGKTIFTGIGVLLAVGFQPNELLRRA